MKEDIKLYFNEKEHKYTDNRGYTYTSMTTSIGKYEEKFDTKKMALRCSRSKKSQYYGMTVKAIEEYWKKENAKSLVKGNRIHNFLEDEIKKGTGYHLENNFINDEIYTVQSILNRTHQNKNLTLDFFVKNKIAEKYPRIYKLLTLYNDMGFAIYSEIGIFSADLLISGLIDILLINWNTKEFIILDWKTNKHEMIPFNKERYKYISGYFKKDKMGNETRKFVETNTYFKFPISHLQQSHYLIYSLQLSGYATLVEKLGLKLKSIVLCHIREEKKYKQGDAEVERIPSLVGLDVTDLHNMPYLNKEMESLFLHHFENYQNRTSSLPLWA